MNFKKHNLEIITKPKDWNSVLQEIGHYDFYHTYDYHTVDKFENQVPTLFKYTENDYLIALPLLIRKIDNTSYYDATSVYGYAGPISKGLDSSFSNEQFIKELLNFFQHKNIISVFSRLNPYINNQHVILENLGDIVNQGKVVNIDLKLNKVIQRQHYQDRLKTHINKSRRHCIIKKAESPKELKDFIAIYYENMNRVKAEKHYYFNQDYFEKILTSKSFNTELLLAQDKKTGITMAGSLFVITNNIVQYHLGGTKSEFLNVMPSKALIDEMRIIAANQGLEYFNLGGGLGGIYDNSLFKFKASFSKDFKDFKLWKLIINQKAYDNLVLQRKITDTSFFPKYRYLDKTK